MLMDCHPETTAAGITPGREADDQQTEDGSEHGLLLARVGANALVGRPATPFGAWVAACRSTKSSDTDAGPESVMAPIFCVRHGRTHQSA